MGKCLLLICQYIAYVPRGKTFITVEVRANAEEKAKMVFLPTYMETNTARIKITNISAEVGSTSLMATVSMVVEEKITLFQV